MTNKAVMPPAGAAKQATLAPPSKLHHTAYVTHDVGATVAFYTEILGMKLVSTVIDDRVPSTGDSYPYVHLFFEMGDGSTIAFFESLDLPKPAPVSHPAYNIFNHLALDVGSKEAVERWAERLRAHGVDIVGPTDHGIIYSVYFYDPNGIRLELTADVVPDWKDHEAEAAADIRDWKTVKATATKTGDRALATEWIIQRRAKHKKDLPVD